MPGISFTMCTSACIRAPLYPLTFNPLQQPRDLLQPTPQV